MAHRQLFKRLLPVVRHTVRAAAPTFQFAKTHLPRHAIVGQNLAARLSARMMSTTAGQGECQIINIQDEDDFEKYVLKSQVPVVVDFHANWCGPCQVLGPRLESIIAQQQGKVVMAKIDIDENVELAMKYNVQILPYAAGFKNGKVVSRLIGTKLNDQQIKDFMRPLLEEEQ